MPPELFDNFCTRRKKYEKQHNLTYSCSPFKYMQVQTGFGRTGTHYWGFEGHDVIPDIGKSQQQKYPERIFSF